METSTLIIFLVAISCPIGMGLAMWWMNKRMRDRPDYAIHSDRVPASPTERLAALEQYRQDLEAEIVEATRAIVVEAGREGGHRGTIPLRDKRVK